MKKVILLLILILVLVYVLFSQFGQDPEKAAEKLFYRAMKARKQIVINPEVVPPGMVVSVENDLQKIIEKYAQSSIAKEAHLILAQFYLRNKKYGKVRSTADEIMKRYSQDRFTLSKAHFLKGNAFERENQWEKAQEEYTILRDEYTDTLLGLEIPLYIANYYVKKEKYIQAEHAYNQAIQFYEKLEQEGQGQVLGYTAANFLLQAFINLNNYEEAAEVLEEIINNYPSLLTLQQLLPQIEHIFVRKLQNQQKAIEIYRNLQEKTSDQELIRVLEKKIKALESRSFSFTD